MHSPLLPASLQRILKIRYARLLISVLVFLLATAAMRAVETQKEKPKKSEAEVQKPASQSRSKPAAEQAAKSEAKSEVALTGHLSRESAGPGEETRFWITIENNSSGALRDVSLEHVDANGFQMIRRCWSDNSANAACRAEGESSPQLPASCGASRDFVCREIPPRQSVTVWGDLGRLYKSPKEDAFAVVNWTRDGFSSRGVVTLGSLESLGWIRSKWALVTQQWELGVPFWLAVFSGVYAVWQSRRERRLHLKDQEREGVAKREAAAREERERQAAREFDRRSNTWNLLLKELQRLSISHYMAIASTLQGALQYLGLVQDPATQTEDNFLAAFCYLIRFHWRIREMKRGGASWQFKDLTAEELIVELFQAYRVKFGLVDVSRQATLDTFLDGIKEETTIAEMVRNVKAARGARKRFWEDFKTWAVSPEAQASLVLLTVMIKIINFETNRPYMYWYEERRPISLCDPEKAEIERIASHPLLSDDGLADRAKVYLEEAAKHIKINH